MKKILPLILSLFTLVSFSKAVIVSFDGGIATTLDGQETEVTTTNQVSDVSSYQEETITLTYNLYENAGISSWQTVGDYYGTENSVIHGHWEGLNSIEIERVNNIPFDLQYFQITSNTSIGGGPSTGDENIAIQGFLNGVAVTQLFGLPSENWGPETVKDVFLPDSFDNVDKVIISDRGTFAGHTGGSDCPTCNSAYCFGMDNFVFDEVVPETLIQGNAETLSAVPEISASLLCSLSLIFLLRRKR